MWSSINTILGKIHKSSSTSIILNDIIINEPDLIASSFNSYFNSISTTLSNNINNNILTFENCLVNQIPDAENFQLSSIPEISKITTNRRQSNSVGWDNIATTILKSNINILAPILYNLINKSLATGVPCKSLKRAKILHIFKNKDKLDITNYCPISISYLSSAKFMKKFFIIDSITISLLITYYHHLNLVSDLVQAPNMHALLKFSDDIEKLFDQNKVEIATFMDLSKAFDCVDHNILLSKLKRYGIHETALQWINSYLSDTEHFVSWNQTHSPLLKPNYCV